MLFASEMNWKWINLKNGNFSGDHMKNVLQIESRPNMEKLTEIASSDDQTGKTKPENNREYGATLVKGKVIESSPGPVTDPTKGMPATFGAFEGVTTMHSHPSGTKRLLLGTSWATAMFGGDKQAPSAQDIKVANSKTNYVFGMRDGTIYMYNKKGVIATIPLSTFKKP